MINKFLQYQQMHCYAIMYFTH